MKDRLLALDVFRGATVGLMILVNNPGTWSALYPPLAHAAWHGCTPTDLVFPFFLFAVGNALALVMPGLLAAGTAVFWRRVLQRTVLIFVIGLLLNAAPFVRWDAAGELVPRSLDTLRIMGVLQRIALCFGAAAVLVWILAPRFGPRAVLAAAAALLLGYWLACETLGASGDVYSLQGWFGTAWDHAWLGEAHLYRGEGMPFDPEGLASTAPAVAQVLLGWWAGQMLASRSIDHRLLLRLMLHGLVLLALAWCWQLQMPLNKKIWTSSYVLHTTGLAMMALAACLYALHLRPAARVGSAVLADSAGLAGKAGLTGQTGPTDATGPAGTALRILVRVLEGFGKNPLFIFVLSGLVPRLLSLLRWPAGVNADGLQQWITPLPWLYKTLFAGLGSDPRLGSLLFALANLSVYALLALWMDRRRLYIRV